MTGHGGYTNAMTDGVIACCDGPLQPYDINKVIDFSALRTAGVLPVAYNPTIVVYKSKVDDLEKRMQKLCQDIEGLPASPSQTDISLAASEIRRELSELNYNVFQVFRT